MSKIIASSAIRGAHRSVARAEDYLARAIAERGPDCPAGFPDSAYFMPVIYSLLGRRIERLADMRPVLEECRALLPAVPADEVWLPYLGNTLDAGMATLFAFEIIEACKYRIGPHPVNGIWLGAASDVIIRERGIEFVDGSAPGFAAIVGAAPTREDAVRIARELQEKNLYVFMASETGGVSFAEQLADAGVQLGWDTRLVPFGKDISAVIYALGFANRVALSFGNVPAGDYTRNLHYNKDRIFAFVMALGEVTEEKYAAAAGAISYGFPAIADTNIPQILPTGICTYEHVVSSVPIERIVEKCLEVRGCQIKVTKVPVPVAYGPAFEGERVRKEQTYLEFGGNRTPAFEFVTMRELAEIEDGKITVVGPEIEDVPPGSALPLGIWVEVAGRKMQADFEPILERQIHHLINAAAGVWHMGQRDINWIRISKPAQTGGFRIRHMGEIIRARFLNDYPAIVNKVQIALFTGKDEVESRMTEARHVYRVRNQRLESLTDESVDTYYSCLLCQSFAPNHVCIITPERLGLCGAYNWLDGKAAYEIDPTGPNQPLLKVDCIDPVRGQWRSINEYVFANSRQTIRVFNAYSLLEYPMTSCGCFEAIVALLPECNGVIVVNREYLGETPVGMKFSTLANMTGGGQQTPGFIGVGKGYIPSRKFIAAEGGHRRIVWMPRELKEYLREDLERIGQRLGIENFIDKIADETNGTDAVSVRAHLEKVDHPALSMPEITAAATDTAAAEAARPAAVTVAANGSAAVSTAAVAEPLAAGPEPPVIHSQPKEVHTSMDGIGGIISVLERLRNLPLHAQVEPGMSREQQRAALEASTALHLLHAGANMLLMYSGDAGPPPTSVPSPVMPPARAPAQPEMAAAPIRVAPGRMEPPKPRPLTSALPRPERPLTPATILAPTSFSVPQENAKLAIRTVTLGGAGTRTSAVVIGGAEALPFRYYEGKTGRQPVIAMEIFDCEPRGYPDTLRAAYGPLLRDPAAMARHCVEELGAEVISVRLAGTHPENGNKSPEAAADLIQDILRAVGVPLIVTGTNHFEKNNAVMRHIAAAFAGENLLLNWAETDNYKTIAAAAMGYGHCVVAQSPIDVNMCKQLNILLTNMDVAPEKIVIDPYTGALGYGLEYTYSVMERIRTGALAGDAMLAMPMLTTPGYEVARTKESRAAERDYPQWGPEAERGALLEIATAAALLNAGADLLILYQPAAARALRRKIQEMTHGAA